jgi:hypothetical protein
VAGVSLGQPGGGSARAVKALSVRGRERPPAVRNPAPPAARPIRFAAPALSLSMPRNRTEAIQVLGMGVRADTGEAAIKKIVDGLRLSWHPDLARDEADRQLRELRIKQINAAWDIIQGKRGEV